MSCGTYTRAPQPTPGTSHDLCQVLAVYYTIQLRLARAYGWVPRGAKVRSELGRIPPRTTFPPSGINKPCFNAAASIGTDSDLPRSKRALAPTKGGRFVILSNFLPRQVGH